MPGSVAVLIEYIHGVRWLEFPLIWAVIGFALYKTVNRICECAERTAK